MMRSYLRVGRNLSRADEAGFWALEEGGWILLRRGSVCGFWDRCMFIWWRDYLGD